MRSSGIEVYFVPAEAAITRSLQKRARGMSNYRRNLVPGGIYFFTVVPYGRRPILTTDAGRRFLHESILEIRTRFFFELFATVLFPDHWHLIMQLPPSDDQFSLRMKRIKEEND